MSTTTTKRKPRPAPPAVAEDVANMKRANFFMPPSMIEGIDKIRADKGGSQGEHVRKAVSAYLKRFKIEA